MADAAFAVIAPIVVVALLMALLFATYTGYVVTTKSYSAVRWLVGGFVFGRVAFLDAVSIGDHPYFVHRVNVSPTNPRKPAGFTKRR